MIEISTIAMIAGFLLIVLELVIGIQTGFDFLLIGSILVISGVTGEISKSTPIMLGLTTILSLIYFFFGRNVVRSRISTTAKNSNVDQLVGASGNVVREITENKAGRVKVGDEEWRATSDTSISVGRKIIVSSIDGVTLSVKEK